MGRQVTDEPTTAVDRRNSRLYLVGLGFSLLGDSALSLVAGIWVKTVTGSSALAGLVQMCIYLPSLLGPLAGLLVDRVPRQRFLVMVNLCSAAVVGSLMLVNDSEQVWLIYVVMLGYGTSLVLIDPAETALFTHMLPTPLRQRVNGWRLGMQETGRLLAPLVGAGLFAALGGQAVAALDAGTFLVAAVATAMLRPPPEPAPPPRESWRVEVMAGFAHIRNTPLLALVTTAAATIMAVSGVGVAAQFSMVSALGRPPSFLGVLSAVLGAGSVVASLTSSRVLARSGLVDLVLLGLLAFVGGTLLRVMPSVTTAMAGSLLLGFALPWVFLAALNAVQQLTPPHLQGRVSAALGLLLFGPQAPTQAVGSFLIAHVGYQEIYVASVFAAVTTAAAVSRKRKRTPAGHCSLDGLE